MLNLNKNDEIQKIASEYENLVNEVSEHKELLSPEKFSILFQPIIELLSAKKESTNHTYLKRTITDLETFLKTKQEEKPFHSIQEKIEAIIHSYQNLYLLSIFQKTGSQTELDQETQEYVKKLIALTDQKKILGEGGENLLLLCAKSTNQFLQNLVKDCVDFGADPFSKDSEEITALEYACYGNQAKNVRLLYEKCRMHPERLDLFSPIDLAIQQGNWDSLSALLEAGLRLDSVVDAQGMTFGEKLFRVITGPKNILSLSSKGKLKEIFWKKWTEGNFSLTCPKQSLQSLWDLSVKNKDHSMSDPLIEQEAFPVSLKTVEEQLFVLEIFQKAIEKQDLTRLNQLVKHRIIPFRPDKNGRLPIIKALQKVDLKEIENAYKLTDSIKIILVSLDSLSSEYMTTSDLGIRLILENQIKEKIDQLKQQDFLDIIHYEQFMEGQFEEVKRRVKQAEILMTSMESTPEQFILSYRSSANESEDVIQKDAVSLCILQRKYSMLSRLQVYKFGGFTSLNFLTGSFLLDKILIIGKDLFSNQLPFEGKGSEALPPIFLSKALHDISIELSQSNNNFFQYQMICQNLIKSFGLCSKWNGREDFAKNIAPEIISHLTDIDFPIVVYTGTFEHSIILGIEKEINDNFRVAIYNTGDGLENHSQWKKTNYHQTHLVFENVPLASLQKIDTWIKILEPYKCRSAKEAYEAFNDLVKGGRKASPSSHFIDYEQAQVHGTCSAQSLMAFIRDYVMRCFPATEEGKRGAYKFFKALLYGYIGTQNLDKTDKSIKNFVEQKLNKSNGLLGLMKIVENEERFISFYEAFQKWLEKTDPPAAQVFAQLPKNSCFEKFYFLKIATLTIAQSRLSDSNIEKEIIEDPTMTELVKASEFLFIEKSMIKNQVFNLLDDNLKNKDWENLLKNLDYLNDYSSYIDMGIRWFNERFNRDTQALKIVDFNGLINEIKKVQG